MNTVDEDRYMIRTRKENYKALAILPPDLGYTL